MSRATSKPKVVIWMLVLAWFGVTAYFYTQMMSFDRTAGAEGHAPSSWPAKGLMKLADGRPTLLMFLHPKCICSRASLDLLSELQREFPGRFHTILATWQPQQVDENQAAKDWEQPLPDSGRFADYEVIRDRGGRLAEQFGAHTSGQTLVYDTSGRLRFSGGITSYRGDASIGPPFAAIRAVMRGQDSFKRFAVFGCSW